MNALSGWLGVSAAQAVNLAGGLVAVLLTLAVMSRLLGENLFSRLAQHLFVGVAAGYAVGLAWWHILWPRLLALVADPVGHWPLALFMVLGLLLLARGIKPASPLGDAPVSVLLGVSVGLALVGAMRGTLLPQAAAAVRGPSLASTMPPWLGTASVLTMALATIVTLAAFYHQQRAHGLTGAIDRVFHALGAVGRRLVMVALGAVLAGAWVTFFAALQGRVAVVQRFVEQIIGLWSRAP